MKKININLKVEMKYGLLKIKTFIIYQKNLKMSVIIFKK